MSIGIKNYQLYTKIYYSSCLAKFLPIGKKSLPNEKMQIIN